MSSKVPSEGLKTNQHHHQLVFYTREQKGYSSGGWSCNICRAHHNCNIPSLFCIECRWDLCDKCMYKEQDEYYKKNYK